MRENAVLVQKEASLVGVLTESETAFDPGRLPTIVVLNAGLIHRVGPNRIYVKIARDLASLGHTVLRFDFSGTGDSPPRVDATPFATSSVLETRQMMDYLTQTRRIRRFVLLGICSGAEVALKTASTDDRVVGLVAINAAFSGDHHTERQRQSIKAHALGRYYRRAVLDPKKWLRVLRGQSDLRRFLAMMTRRCRRLFVLTSDEHSPVEVAGQWRALMDRDVDALLVYSEGSSTFDAFSMVLEPGLKNLNATDRISVEFIECTDHVFTPLWSQERLGQVIRSWFLARSGHLAPKEGHGRAPAVSAAVAEGSEEDGQ